MVSVMGCWQRVSLLFMFNSRELHRSSGLLPITTIRLLTFLNCDLLTLVFITPHHTSPTIPHCSMATLIGLSLRVKLLRSLPPRFKVVVEIESGTHASEHAVNKQLADKERVRAALENEHLLGVVNKCIAGVA